MKKFEKFEELTILADCLQGYFKTILGDVDEEDMSENIADVLGGDVFLCETTDDLLKVEGVRHGGDGFNYQNIIDGIPGFDVGEYLGDKEFAVLALMTNNAGGDSYIIPKELFQHIPNLEAIIKEAQC